MEGRTLLYLTPNSTVDYTSITIWTAATPSGNASNMPSLFARSRSRHGNVYYASTTNKIFPNRVCAFRGVSGTMKQTAPVSNGARNESDVQSVVGCVQVHA